MRGWERQGRARPGCQVSRDARRWLAVAPTRPGIRVKTEPLLLSQQWAGLIPLGLSRCRSRWKRPGERPSAANCAGRRRYLLPESGRSVGAANPTQLSALRNASPWVVVARSVSRIHCVQALSNNFVLLQASTFQFVPLVCFSLFFLAFFCGYLKAELD